MSAASSSPPAAPLTLAHPWRWLALGARDLARAPWPGLSHGLRGPIPLTDEPVPPPVPDLVTS